MNKSNNERVVITGLGILAPNAHGLDAYEAALRNGVSGIKQHAHLAEHKFACQVGGIPENVDVIKHGYLSEEKLMGMNEAMVFGAIAAIDCWRDAGLPEPADQVDWDTGAIIGTGISGLDTIGGKLVPMTDAGKVRRLGSTMVEQVMASSSSANIGGLLGLGGQVTTNSSACTTGTEAIANAYFAIMSGRFKRMLVGGTEGASLYSWAGFDAMRVLARGYNDKPEQASRPMSASAVGFVPGSGAGLLMVESLSSAKKRGARIYAEGLGVDVNCGGQRNGGSTTFPNPTGVQRCIKTAIKMAGIDNSEVDLINGHLTATMADPSEINNWQQALACDASDLPLINSTKSMIGHGLGAAGGMECVAAVLQLAKGFVHGSLNCEDLHPELQTFANSVVHKTRDVSANILAKASFGFGDVNACLIFRRW
ncbi:MAG: beta-ketoacyl-[acyl-carrier-protein] synthase family protein [Proteobacteria bacterium]|nr:beta-ketoacyl-[acyl-carrier-protein] synthase family protein [Pseudomonadota bacterium]